MAGKQHRTPLEVTTTNKSRSSSHLASRNLRRIMSSPFLGLDTQSEPQRSHHLSSPEPPPWPKLAPGRTCGQWNLNELFPIIQSWTCERSHIGDTVCRVPHTSLWFSVTGKDFTIKVWITSLNLGVCAECLTFSLVQNNKIIKFWGFWPCVVK